MANRLQRALHCAGQEVLVPRCIDGYSRFIIAAEQFEHELATAATVAVLERQSRLPKAILSDHGSKFKEKWKDWYRQHGVEALFAHPSYPQGKVERCIQNINREFINQLRKNPQWLNVKISEHSDWFNHSRYHIGINAYLADLYECKVDMTHAKILSSKTVIYNTGTQHMSSSLKETIEKIKALEEEKKKLQAELETLQKQADAKANALEMEVGALRNEVNSLKTLINSPEQVTQEPSNLPRGTA